MARVNPLLQRLAQRDPETDLLTVLRAARDSGMEILRGGADVSGPPPRPDMPFSVIWFDEDVDRYGRIGIGMVGCSYAGSSTAPIEVLTEESWVARRSEEVVDPRSTPSLMRWSVEDGWMNDHVIYLVESHPYRFLINWTVNTLK